MQLNTFMKDFSKYSAIIIGAGDATGAALTKKFASKGYKVCPANTSWAVEKGAFGIPTFLIDDQIFFGKDHMDQLEDYINSIK